VTVAAMGVVVKMEVWVWWWRIFKYFPYIDEHRKKLMECRKQWLMFY